MSKDNSREKNSHPVCSKYFSTKSMDESLRDFQEPKKLAGPKNTSKPSKPDKPKRAPKKIRGQGDIRKVLKSKKTELESYSKDFDHVCKQAGLDVDSEQLQLAIALSKSLQQSNSTGESSETTQPLNTQDRVGKIRSTLLEYGFKVPDIKIKTTKRLKKRKKYKLLLTSEEAKNQIVSDKYSQVLFENIPLSKDSLNLDIEVNRIQLYYLATSATYSVLKIIDTFYVNGLLEKSISTGNLLRDWSEIRGRPVSPKPCNPVIMNFSEIECSQDELDVVLSGSLKSCKNVIKSKVEQATLSSYKLSEKKELGSACKLDDGVIVLIDDEKDILKSIATETRELGELSTQRAIDSEKVGLENPIAMLNHYRSCSPDLFDDEPSTVINEEKVTLSEMHNTVSNHYYSMDLTDSDQEKTSKLKIQVSQDTNVTRRCIDFMEITDCVEVQGLYTNSGIKESTLKLSQNVTKRKSNDFMEITDCIEVKKDLDPSPGNKKNASDSAETTNVKCTEAPSTLNVEMVQTNLDADMENINRLATKHSSRKEISTVRCNIENINIDLTDHPDLEQSDIVRNKSEKCIDSLDLTQSSNTSDELPFISLKTKDKTQSADDTIILDPKEYEGISKALVSHAIDEVLDLTQNMMHEDIYNGTQSNFGDDSRQARNIEIDINVQKADDILDLTQEVGLLSKHNSRTSDANVSFFEDYVLNHSDNNDVYTEITHNDNISKADFIDRDICSKSIDHTDVFLTHGHGIKSATKHTETDDIDLTQSSESSKELSQNFQNKDYSILKEVSEVDREETNEMEITDEPQSDIDLIQHSGSEEYNNVEENNDSTNKSINIDTESNGDATIEMKIIKSSQRCSSLGKKDDVSIDYDELYDNLMSRYSRECSQESITSSKSAADTTHNVSNKSKDTSYCSQNSQVFEISDNELDYSMHKSKLDKPVDNFLFGGISIMDDLPSIGSFRRSNNIEINSAVVNKNGLANVNQINQVRAIKHKRVKDLVTPQKPSCSGINTVVTPRNSQYVIKTLNVTPMPKYESMSIEELHGELDKFGVKPFKRKRAVQLLTHIYNQTHPTVESCSDEESPRKRRKTAPRKILSPKKSTKSPKKVPESKKKPKISSTKKPKEITYEKGKDSGESKRLNDPEFVKISKNYEVDETPVIKEVVCSPDDWVFQKREKAKIHSCRVPLHIAFHNYVYSRRALREAILCYEPINIDDIHKDLVAYGHRYDPKDLLKFMDKKCITVKTTDNDGRNQKR